MGDDPRIHWSLSNSYGIWKRENTESWFLGRESSPSDIWNSGRSTDVLIRPDGNLVVATGNGGIWLVPDTTAGGTFCVSDAWEDSAFKSLALGIRGDDHVFGGGNNGALYMTDTSTVVPLLNWIKLESFVRDAPAAGTIRDIVVLRGSEVIVVACDGGIFWARILGALGDSFNWRQAGVEGSVGGGFYCIAEGPPQPGPQAHPNGPIVETMMAGGMGSGTTTGFFSGQWDPADNLQFRRAHLFNLSSDVTLFSSAMSFAVVTSFPLNRNFGYAACIASYSDSLFAIFKTSDGGRTWQALQAKMPGLDITKAFADAFGSSQNGHNLCIAVSNSDADVVTLGLRNGAISFDGGTNWTKPGFDSTQATGIVTHIHADLTNYAFGRTTTTEVLPPSSYYVASDGGIAQIRWGDGAWVIESDVTEGEHQGNLYAVLLDGNNLVLHVRHSSGAKKNQWEVESTITSKATGSGCLIQSTFAGGDSGNRNLEVIVPDGSNLVHYWCAIQNGRYATWNAGPVITPFATGPGCLIQSTMGTGADGNFEVVALEGSDLVHYWRDNGAPGFPWHAAATISTMASAPGCVIQSSFKSGDNGNLEVVVLEGLDLIHYWHDSSTPSSSWNRAAVIHEAESAGCFFQSDYPKGADHGNFELVFRLDNQLMHCFKDNSSPGNPWSSPVTVTAPGRKVSGPGCVFQGNYGTDDVHGNFELLVPENAAMVHYYRDNGRSNFPWFPTTVVAEPLFTFRSDFNRSLASLEFYAPFGASMLVDGALVGPLQDNGIVDGVAGTSGTPWFELEAGDGIAAFYLSGQSPKIGAPLLAGITAVHQNNALDSDTKSIRGNKSAHLQPDTLVPDNHGKSGNVIPTYTEARCDTDPSTGVGLGARQRAVIQLCCGAKP